MKHCELETVERFNDTAAAYAKARPSYPGTAIEAILAGVGDGAIVDIGAGTAIASRLMASSGRRVFATDPNLLMLRESGSHPEVVRIVAPAECMPFKTNTASLITAFNSFHWFQPDEFLSETRRVLRAGGRLAVVWNDWDLRDAFTSGFVHIMRKGANDFPPEDRELESAALYGARGFTPVARTDYPNQHVMDRETLHLRLASISYLRDSWRSLIAEIDELFDRHAARDGRVTHRYITPVFAMTRLE